LRHNCFEGNDGSGWHRRPGGRTFAGAFGPEPAERHVNRRGQPPAPFRREPGEEPHPDCVSTFGSAGPSTATLIDRVERTHSAPALRA
jgi:hypothetical protein